MTQASVASELVVKILADSQDFEKGLKQAKSSLSDVDKAADKTSDEFRELDETASKSGYSLSSSASRADELSDALRSTTDETEDLADATTDAAGTQDKHRNSMDLAAPSATALAGALAGVAVALTAIAVEGLKAQTQLDEALRTIAFGTGRIGEEADGLREVWQNVNRQVTQPAEDVSAAVANLNTLWGVEGDELEALSIAYLNFAKVSGGDVVSQIDALNEVFKKFHVSVAEQGDVLEKFAKISQATGVNVDQMLSILGSGDRAFELLGISVTDAAAMIGKVKLDDGIEAAGEFTNALEKVAVKMSTIYGSDAEVQKGLREMIASMRLANSETEAAKILIEEYEMDERSAAALSGAIFAGIMDTDAVDALTETGHSMQELIDSTETLDDKMTMAWKNIDEKFLPVGNELKQMFIDMEPAISDSIGMLGGIIKGAEPLLRSLHDLLIFAFDPSENGMAAFLKKCNPMFSAFAAIGDWFSDKGSVLVEKLSQIVEKVFRLVGGSGSISKLTDALAALCDFIDGVVTVALDGMLILLSALAGDSEEAANIFETSFSGALSRVSQFFYNFAADITIGVLELMTNVTKLIDAGLDAILQGCVSALNGLLELVEMTANAIIETVENALNIAVDAINAIISAYNMIPGVAPVPLAQHVSFGRVDIPKIEIGEFTAATDALTAKIEELNAAKAAVNNEFNITINAGDKESAMDIAQKTSKQIARASGVA